MIISICRIPIRVEPLYEYTSLCLASYVTRSEFYKCEIMIDEPEIDSEIDRNENKSFERGYYEFSLLCRKLATVLLSYSCVLLHSSAIEIDGVGYLFLGKSGTGKSTLSEFCIRQFPNSRIINGDKPFIRVSEDGTVRAYGTPWCGKENYQVNDSVEIHWLVFLTQGERNSLQTISKEEAMIRILHQINIPERREAASTLFCCLDTLLTVSQTVEYEFVNMPIAAQDLLRFIEGMAQNDG